MFTLTIEGQYYAEGKKLKKYYYQCNVPKMAAALSVVKNKIEERKMQKLYPDFMAVRTRAIVKVDSDQANKPAPGTDNIAEMTIDQLKDLVITKDLPIDIAEYSDVIELRKDISDAIQNLELFLKTKKEKSEQKAADKELEDLNPDLKDTENNATEQAPTAENPLAGLE